MAIEWDDIPLPAASAAAAMVRALRERNAISREEAYLITDWIDREVKLGRLPDDAAMLGLIESGEWRVATSSTGERPQRVGKVLSFGWAGITGFLHKRTKDTTEW